jgi:hypothetical protein
MEETMTNNTQPQLPDEVVTDGKSNYTWHTDEDIRFVLDNYPEIPIEVIADKLNMTQSTVINIIKTNRI